VEVKEERRMRRGCRAAGKGRVEPSLLEWSPLRQLRRVSLEPSQGKTVAIFVCYFVSERVGFISGTDKTRCWSAVHTASEGLGCDAMHHIDDEEECERECECVRGEGEQRRCDWVCTFTEGSPL